MSENGLQLLMLGQRQNILAASDCDEFRKNEQTRNTIEKGIEQRKRKYVNNCTVNEYGIHLVAAVDW